MNISKTSAFLAIAAIVLGARVVAAQGTLQVAGKDFKLEHAVAYQTKSGGEKETVVLLCAKPLPIDKLKEKLKQGNAASFFIPEAQVQLDFDQKGKLGSVLIWADSTSISTTGTEEGDKVEAKFSDGKAQGKVSMSKQNSTPKYKFDVSFDVPFIKY
jgi:hypothetical protein